MHKLLIAAGGAALTLTAVACGRPWTEGRDPGVAGAGSARVFVTARVVPGQPYQGQSLVPRLTLQDVDHVLVRVLHLTGAVEEPVLDAGGRPVEARIPAANLDSVVALSNLAAFATYRLRGYAYRSEGEEEPISETGTGSFADVRVTDDSAPSQVALLLKLRDVPFSARGTPEGTLIQQGGIRPAGPVRIGLGGYSVSTLAGNEAGFVDGPALDARFDGPAGIVADGEGSVYVADSHNHAIRLISPGGQVTTLVGGTRGAEDGDAASARLDSPSGLALDPAGNLVVADTGNHRIRRIGPSGETSTVAGSSAGFLDGPVATARFQAPRGVAVTPDGRIIVADTASHCIRSIAPGGSVSTLAGTCGSEGFADGSTGSALFRNPAAIAYLGGAEEVLLVADSGNHAIRRIASGIVSTLAGSGDYGDADGRGQAARFDEPSGLAVDSGGNVFVADTSNNTLRRVSAEGEVTTVAGSGFEGNADGRGGTAEFAQPGALHVIPGGDLLLCDTGNNRIRRLSSSIVGL